MHVISAKQQRKFGQIDERKRRRGGRFETGGATFVLLTLPLSDPDFEAGGSMLADLTKKTLMCWPLLSKATTI